MKASLGRGIRVGAKAKVPLSKPMGAVSGDVFKVIKEARNEEVDCLAVLTPGSGAALGVDLS